MLCFFQEIDSLLFAQLPSAASLNWAVLMPVVLGFLAVWYLLPTPRRRPLVFGVLGGVVALIGFGTFLLLGLDRALPIHPETFLFGAFSTLAIGFGGLMITQRNPARAAISFTVVILSVCGLFLLLAAPFLMAATIIIYAGAIIVTFLFVIMLSQATGYSDANDRSREPSLAAAVGFVLLGVLLIVLQRVYNTREIDEIITRVDGYAKAENIDDNLREEQRLNVFQTDLEKAVNRLGFGHPDSIQDSKVRDAVRHIDESRLPLKGLIDLGETEEWKQNMARIRDSLLYLKSVRSGFVPPPGVILSPYGQSRPVDAASDAARQLPDANIAAIGRALYADHLLAIELAGTLLLVATIGTIAIAGRRERPTS